MRRWRSLTFGAGVALLAAGCAHETAREPVRHGHDIRLTSEIERVEATVPAHATLDSLLRDNHLQDRFVEAAVSAARAVFNPRQLRADQPYKLVRSLDGLLREFDYDIDADRFLRIVGSGEDPGSLDASVVDYPKHTDRVSIEARIDDDHPSLIAAIDEAGENVQLAMALADIFSGEVDFQTELQQGDSFKVLFEKNSHDGQFSGYGDILGAAIKVDGRELDAFRWIDASSGKAAYYDRNGRSLHRFFLKSPLKFEPRITSGFSYHRLHPIDHVVKAHLGVDYAAPTGSPVVAIASGTVLSAARSGASGNMVHLRHAGGFETYYLHLSAFAPGMHAGAHVEQGQLIGRVGMTGSATGPHLDFRIKKNGTFVNPVSVHSRQAAGEPIPAVQLAAFRASRDALLNALAPAATVQASTSRKPDDAVRALSKR